MCDGVQVNQVCAVKYQSFRSRPEVGVSLTPDGGSGWDKKGVRSVRDVQNKIPVAERQPLIRPGGANEIRSMDFVFDRVASGRTTKSLMIVDDATHESVAIVAEHSIGGTHLTRLLGEVGAKPGKPAIIRMDNGGMSV